MPDTSEIRSFFLRLWQPPFWGFKVCAVLAALLIWAYVIVTQNPTTEVSYTVSVEMRDLDASLAIPDTNRQVTVAVQGSSAVLNTLTRGQIYAYVDFSEATEGEVTVPVNVDLPDGVTLVSVMPESLSYELVPVVSESFPVEVRLVGEPGSDCTLLDPLTSPDFVTLAGSAEYMEQVAQVFVTADVTDLAESYDKNLSVEVLDASGNSIKDWFTISPATVSAMIPVVNTQPEKSVAISPMIIGEPAVGYEVRRVVVEPSTVRVFGDLNLLDQLYYVETETLDISGLKKNATFTVDLVHNSNLTLAQESVTVVVQIDSTNTKAITRSGMIYPENLSEGLSCESPTAQLELVLSGPQTDIDVLNEADVVPTVNLSGIMEPGVYELPIDLSLPANISLVSMSPSTVMVTVTLSDSASGQNGDGGNE